MARSPARWMVWLLPACSLALGAATVMWTIQSPDARRAPLAEVVSTGVMLVAWAGVGAVIIRSRPRHPVGWLVALVGIVGPVATAGDAYASAEPALSGRDWMYWATSLLGGTVPLWVVVLLLLFPSGRLLSRRWRGVVALACGAQIVLVVGGALSEYSRPGGDDFAFGHPWLDNPLGTISEGHALWGGGIGWPLFVVSLLLAVVSFVVRFRRSGPDERRQLKWLLPPLAVIVVGFLGMELDGADGTFWVLLAGLLAVPVAIGVAILAHRLFDIDVVIRRSVVYAVLWLLIGGIYLTTAAMPGLVVGERMPTGVAIAITVAATLAFQPARRAVDRLVGRLLFGERPSELELLSRFGETVADTFDVTELAPRVADAVRQGLDLHWARVRLEVGDGNAVRAEPAGAAGITLDEPAAPTLTIPLVHGDERLGVVECGPKREGRYAGRDHELLATLCRQAALGIHNARLAAELSARLDEIRRQASELQASRTRLVAAQDNERQRLERNLHDGVQQDVVSLLARLGLARAQLRRDPVVAETTLADLQTQTGDVLRDLRQLVQGIHPPVLTDRGLLEALEARLSHVPVGVQLHAAPALRGTRFGPDVEAAAYFFVSEGLTNTMKHATASNIAIRLAANGERLTVTVEDDGIGFVPAGAAGSGLTGLRDRVEAVGGTMRVRSAPGAGCRLTAVMPVAERVGRDTG